MFKKEDLKSYIGDTIEINGNNFILSLTMTADKYVWKSNEYNIYTYVNEIIDQPLNVKVTTHDTRIIIGIDHAGIKSEDYETYKRRTILLAENIFRSQQYK